MGVTYRHHRLSNGLVVLGEIDPAAHSAAAGFFVRTGARDEDTRLMGVSHFLEHMMFKGTARLTAEDINRGFDDMGARNNAYTSSEVTCFYAHVLPEKLDHAVGLLAEMLRPALRQDDFDTEKKVILEEIAMYKDNPFWVLYEEAVQRHYAAHGMGHRVLGTAESVGAMQRDEMAAYFESRYAADNTVLSVAGRVDFDAVCARAEGLCGSWRPQRPARDTSRPPVGAGGFEVRDEKVSRAYLIGLAPAPSSQDDRRYAAALAASVLGASDNSRLHWTLIETGLAEEAQAAYDPHDGTGDYFVYASGEPDRADEIWKAVLNECENLAASVVDDDLARLKTKLETSVTLSGERPADRMQRLGRVWTTLGVYAPLEDELERIRAVRVQDVREVLEEFAVRPVTWGRLLPA